MKTIRLIDGNRLKASAKEEIGNRLCEFGGWCTAFRDVLSLIDDAPAVDPESLRPRGRWIKNADGEPACTNCNGTALLDGSEDYVLSEFCPNCGAKMED